MFDIMGLLINRFNIYGYLGVLVKIISENAADMINLKISKVGGLSKARVIRDLAVQSGIPMNIEDTW